MRRASETRDLIVIGGGAAGLSAALTARALGASVALVEAESVGGSRARHAVPWHTILAAGRAAAVRRDSGHLGLLGKAKPVDLALVMEAARRARTEAIGGDPLERAGVTTAVGAASFTAPRTILVDGRTWSAPRIILASGTRAAPPALSGGDVVRGLTWETLPDLSEVPASMAVIGGGARGVEVSQALQRLGVPVLLLERGPELLLGEEPEAVDLVRQALVSDGVTIKCGAHLTRASRQGTATVVEWQEPGGGAGSAPVSALLNTVGGPATGPAGLESLGVVVSREGVATDRYLRTKLPGVWAAGDITPHPRSVPMAERQGALAATNALGSRRAFSAEGIPRIVHTSPVLARVGETVASARARGVEARSGVSRLEALDLAVIERRSQSLVKLVATPRGRLLGATVVGDGAADLMPLLAWALRNRLGAPELARLEVPYPSLAEGLRAAIREGLGLR